MTLNLLEGAINALYTYISSNIATKVAALNTRYSSSLVVPKVYYKGNYPMATPEYPSLVILGTGWTPKVQRLNSLHLTNNITLIVFWGDDDAEARFLYLARYALGLTEMLQAGESSMGYHVSLGGPVVLTDNMNTQPFLQAIMIPVNMEQIETY